MYLRRLHPLQHERSATGLQSLINHSTRQDSRSFPGDDAILAQRFWLPQAATTKFGGVNDHISNGISAPLVDVLSVTRDGPSNVPYYVATRHKQRNEDVNKEAESRKALSRLVLVSVSG
jgi:hypothetical protein